MPELVSFLTLAAALLEEMELIVKDFSALLLVGTEELALVQALAVALLDSEDQDVSM